MIRATIRDGRPEDVPAIAAIWNDIISNTVISFWPSPRSDAEILDYMTGRQKLGHAFIVAQEAGKVLGFASYGQFRAGGGYAHSMEHTIYMADGAQGKGIGFSLLSTLEDHARDRGARLMIGGITAENEGSIAFHRRCGYHEWGRIPAAGYKFGQWHDLVLMGRDLLA